MKALKLVAPGTMEVQEVEIPKCEPGDVLIKVAYAGICGTDLHAYKGEYSRTKFPVVLGHELSGVITEVGEGVTQFKVGDRVTCESTYKPCGTCRYCKKKEYNLCGHRIGIGTNKDGAFEEYMTMQADRVWKLPDNVSLRSAAISEPLACATHSVMEIGNVQEGETVVVFGAGAIGLMVAQVAVAVGATVILAGLTIDEPRFAIAKEMGVQRCVDQMKEDLIEVVMGMTDGGADVAVECSGAVPAFAKAFDVLHKGGRIIQMGLFRGDSIPMPWEKVVQNEISILGSRSQKPSSWQKAMDLFASGKIVPEKAVTMEVPVEEWQEAFDTPPSGKKFIKFDDFGE